MSVKQSATADRLRRPRNRFGYIQFCLFGGDGTYAASQVFQRVQY